MAESVFKAKRNKLFGGKSNLISSIKEINKKINSDRYLSYSAINQLNIISVLLIRRIYHLSLESLHDIGSKTIEPHVIQKAIIDMCPVEGINTSGPTGPPTGPCALSDLFLTEMEKALKTYNINIKNKKDGDRVNLAVAAGILVSPSLVYKHLRLHVANKSLKSNAEMSNIRYDVRVSKTGKIVLAAFIHHFITLIIVQIENRESLRKNKKITPREMLLAIDSNDSISHFFNHNHVYILEAGIIPRHPIAKNSPEAQIANKNENRAYQVTKLEKEIIELQNDTSNVFRYKPTKKIIKSLFKLLNDRISFRIEKDAAIDLINYTECRIVDLMRQSIDLWQITGGKISLSPHILIRVAAMNGIHINNYEVTDDSSVGINASTVDKLARKAGSLRTIKKKNNEQITTVVTNIAKYIMMDILTSSIKSLELHHQTTFSTMHLIEGAFSRGYIIPSYRRKTDPK